MYWRCLSSGNREIISRSPSLKLSQVRCCLAVNCGVFAMVALRVAGWGVLHFRPASFTAWLRRTCSLFTPTPD